MIFFYFGIQFRLISSHLTAGVSLQRNTWPGLVDSIASGFCLSLVSWVSKTFCGKTSLRKFKLQKLCNIRNQIAVSILILN